MRFFQILMYKLLKYRLHYYVELWKDSSRSLASFEKKISFYLKILKKNPGTRIMRLQEERLPFI